MANVHRAVGIAVGLTLLVVLLLAAFVTGIGLPGPTLAGPLAILALFALNIVLVVAGIVHALVREDLNTPQRLIWVAIVFFVTPIVALGAIVYFALGRARTREIFRDVNPGGRAAD